MFDVEVPVTTAMASGVEVNVTVVSDPLTTTAGFEAGDQIMIVRRTGSFLANARRTIASVTTSTITLSAAAALEVGDKIIRIYYVQTQETEIQRGFSKYNYVEFKSYFQNFGRVVTFKKTELNKTYLIEKDAKTYVASIFGHNMSILLQEFGKAIWLGQNDNNAGKPEMLGIDTAIMQQFVKDASLVVDFTGVATADQKLNLLLDAFDLSAASGAISNAETLSVACNRKFLSQLGRLKKEDVVYNEKIVEIDFTIYKLKSMFSQVEFFHEPTLDKLSQDSVAYVLPRSLMSLRFRKNQTVTDDKANFEPAKTEICVKKKINNIHDVAQFDMFFEAATVLGGLTSGAYRKLIRL